VAKNQSFDIESTVEMQEIDNALNQTRKELSQRYDFRNVEYELDWQKKDNQITIKAPDDFKLKAIWDVMQNRLVARKLPLKNFQPQDADDSTLGTTKQKILIQQGIPGDKAKEIVKFLKNKKLKKVQSQIQGDIVRITSPSRDDLQGVMDLLRAEDFGVDLQFRNFRG